MRTIIFSTSAIALLLATPVCGFFNESIVFNDRSLGAIIDHPPWANHFESDIRDAESEVYKLALGLGGASYAQRLEHLPQSTA